MKENENKVSSFGMFLLNVKISRNQFFDVNLHSFWDTPNTGKVSEN